MNFVLAISTLVTVIFFSWHLAPQIYASAKSGTLPGRNTESVVVNLDEDSPILKKTLAANKRSTPVKAVHIR